MANIVNNPGGGGGGGVGQIQVVMNPLQAQIQNLPVSLSYNGIRMNVMRVEEFTCEPESDYSGVEYLGINHIVLGVRAAVNPYAVATNTNQGAQDPLGNATPGDRAGATMFLLQQALMVRQKQLIFAVGPDVVVLAPQSANFFRDAKNGPVPLSLRILEIHGTKTCVILFRIECWTGGKENDPEANPVVLSNRWSVRASLDPDSWRSTITTSGRMRLRTDQLDDFGPATPDIFRQAVLPLPIPDGFKREVPEILVKEDCTELQWTCVDKEQALNLGANSAAITVTGQYTSGSDTAYKDIKDIIKSMGAGALALATPVGLLAAAPMLLFSLIPTVKNSFQFRATGPVGANRAGLLNLLLTLALDRFAPQGNPFQLGFPNNPIFVSLYATVSVSEMQVELRGEIFGSLAATFAGGGFVITNFNNLMNLSNDVPALGFQGSAPAPNPQPPSANTSRATYIGALLLQALKGDFAVPPNNAPSERGANAADIGQNFQ